MPAHSCCLILIQVVIGLMGVADVTDSQPTKQTAAPVPDLAQVLSRAREAIGYKSLMTCKGTLLLQGESNEHDLQGAYSLQFTSDGQFLQKLDSRVKELVAFDGITGWGVDASGTPRVLEMDDLESAQTLIWVQTGRWLLEEGPFTVALL